MFSTLRTEFSLSFTDICSFRIEVVFIFPASDVPFERTDKSETFKEPFHQSLMIQDEGRKMVAATICGSFSFNHRKKKRKHSCHSFEYQLSFRRSVGSHRKLKCLLVTWMCRLLSKVVHMVLPNTTHVVHDLQINVTNSPT